ncbi:MAG: hypothetical protein ACXABY_32095 [Candidatus Thorarchaeota archaeon]|jgi:hypothetical protein
MRGESWDYEKELEDVEFSGYLIDVVFRYYGYYTPANLSGHPDNWCPEEGEQEVEFIEMTVKDENGLEVSKTDNEKETLWNDMWQIIERECEK